MRLALSRISRHDLRSPTIRDASVFAEARFLEPASRPAGSVREERRLWFLAFG